MQPASPMSKLINVALWILQILWGVFFSFTGFGKLMSYRADVWNQTLHQPVAWFHAVPQALFVFIGLVEFLGGVGLILPAMTRIKPRLTPIAAAGLALVMLLAAVFQIVRGEYSFFLPMNLFLAAGAALIALGRIAWPVASSSSIGALRMCTGVVVFGLLAFAGYFPVWYQLTHSH